MKTEGHNKPSSQVRNVAPQEWGQNPSSSAERGAAAWHTTLKIAPEQHLRSSLWPKPSEINPHDPNKAREEILLPQVQPDLVELSKQIAAKLKLRYSGSRERKTHALAAERGIGKGATAASMEAFTTSLRAIAESEFKAETKEVDFDELVALSAFFASKATSPKTGFLRQLPAGLFHSDKVDAELDPLFMKRVGVVLRYYYTKVETKPVALHTARDIESYFNAKQLYATSGLRKIAEQLGPIEILNAAFPKITEGQDPAVRPWLIETPGKWQSTPFIGRAVAWVLEYGEQMVIRKDGAPQFDLSRMRNCNWGSLLNSTKYGLQGIFNKNSPANNAQAALALGAEFLGKPDLFGPGPDQLSVADVRTRRIWIGVSANENIDGILQKINLGLRRDMPQLFEGGGTGAIRPAAIEATPRWSKIIDRYIPSLSSRTGISVSDALRRIYPEAFGWNPDQIKPWEYPHIPDWKSSEAPKLVRQGIGITLSRLGLGRITVRGDELQYSFNRDEFEAWLIKFREARENLPQEQRGLRAALYQAKLSGVLKYGVPSQDIRGAICMLFGYADPSEKLAKLQNQCASVGVSSTFRHLLDERGGSFRVVLAQLNPSEALATSKSYPPAPNDFEAFITKPFEQSPYFSGEPSFVSEFELRTMNELRITNLKRLRDTAAYYDPTGTKLAEALGPVSSHVESLKKCALLDFDAQSPAAPYLCGLNRLLLGSSQHGASGAMVTFSDEEITAILQTVADHTLDSTNIRATTANVVKNALHTLLADPSTGVDLLASAFRTASYRARIIGAQEYSIVEVVSSLVDLTMRGAKFLRQGEHDAHEIIEEK